jgi:transposase
LDVFKIAGESISGFLHSWKTGDQRLVRMPYTSTLEARLALFCEYHPHVCSYQRGDMSPAFVTAYGIHAPLGAPYRISYMYEGQPHDYLPDFVGTLCDGSLLIAEAGKEDEKSQGQALVKAEAARRLAQIKGGAYWIGTDKNLSERRYYNLLHLQACRQPFPTYDEIAATLVKQWPRGDFRTIDELVRLFGSRWSGPEVEAAVWKLVADTAATGRLLVDLTEVDLDLHTPLALLHPEAPPILPYPLPSSLEEAPIHAETEPPSYRVEEVSALSLQGAIPGPTFDASVLETTEQQTHFHRNLHAVTAILEGKTLVQVAQAHGMSVSTLGRLVQRTKALGQIACVPYGTYYRNRALHPEFQQLLRKLYTHAMRPTIMAVYEDVRLKRLAEELSEREGRLVRLPTYRQVWSFLNEIRSEARVAQARSGLKHAPHERMSSQSFVLSISSPALICQVDEHVFDQLIVASDGTILTRRVHGAVLICVKTAAILGVALRKLSPGAE